MADIDITFHLESVSGSNGMNNSGAVDYVSTVRAAGAMIAALDARHQRASGLAQSCARRERLCSCSCGATCRRYRAIHGGAAPPASSPRRDADGGVVDCIERPQALPRARAERQRRFERDALFHDGVDERLEADESSGPCLHCLVGADRLRIGATGCIRPTTRRCCSRPQCRLHRAQTSRRSPPERAPPRRLCPLRPPSPRHRRH